MSEEKNIEDFKNGKAVQFMSSPTLVIEGENTVHIYNGYAFINGTYIRWEGKQEGEPVSQNIEGVTTLLVSQLSTVKLDKKTTRVTKRVLN